MKKLTIISLIFLSVQLLSQDNSTEKSSLLQLRNFERTSFSIEENSQDSLPPISLPKFILQSVVGIGLGFAVGDLFKKNFEATSTSGGDGPDFRPIIWFLIGDALGSGLGVYLIGNYGSTNGNLFYTLLGSAFGTFCGALLSGGTETAVPLILLPTAGALFLFNATREFDDDYSDTAILNIKNEKVHFGTPRIFLTRIDETSNKLRYNFELLRVNF